MRATVKSDFHRFCILYSGEVIISHLLAAGVSFFLTIKPITIMLAAIFA